MEDVVSPPSKLSPRPLFSLTLAALGVVFGDIGTSPLYAMRVALDGLVINEAHVLGVLSLVFWSLVLLISIKYLFILFCADNDGEGGVLALLALIKPTSSVTSLGFFGFLGVWGAGLMLGDGMLTPAISVLSAVEGMHIIMPNLSAWVLPLTCLLLFGLFALQSLGTAKIGFLFGPMICLWFVTIAVLGVNQIAQYPTVLMAINPWFALMFLQHLGTQGYVLLGGIFLVVTGGEALYADLGHFGKAPIRLGWFALVFPALLLNYFGQGALLLTHPAAIDNPFYNLAPSWFALPLLMLATLATLIASQAVISAMFSLMRQAILLGFYPRIPIIQTSKSQPGQVYIPQMNRLLAVGAFVLIGWFRSSHAMTRAYGVAVNLVMILSLVLVVYLAISQWRWRWSRIALLVFGFGAIDTAFLGANVIKVETGGLFPLAVSIAALFVMYTWSTGRNYLQRTYHLQDKDLSGLLHQLNADHVTQVRDLTAVFIMDIYDKSGGSFLHFLQLTRMLPERVILLNISVQNTPYVRERFELRCLRKNMVELTVRYGFLDIVSIPQALYVANDRGLLPFTVDVDTAMYFIEIPTVLSVHRSRVWWWWGQAWLFSFLVKNYASVTNASFYQVPFNHTIGMGIYYLI